MTTYRRRQETVQAVRLVADDGGGICVYGSEKRALEIRSILHSFKLAASIRTEHVRD